MVEIVVVVVVEIVVEVMGSFIIHYYLNIDYILIN